MSAKIRLTRIGTKNAPYYRVIVTDSRAPRNGRYIENIGTYDPKKEGVNFDLKLDRVEHWVSKGAQLSETVSSLVKKARKTAVAA